MLVYNALALLSLGLYKIVNNRRIYMVLMYGLMIFFAAARSTTVGSDTGTYENIYESIKGVELFDYSLFDLNNKIEFGVLFIIIISKFLYDSPQTFFALMSFFTLLSLSIFVWKETGRYYYLATFIIITFGFYFYMMNAERQALAIAISCHAISYVMRKKYLKSLVVAIFSSMFHFSMIVIIPLIIALEIFNQDMSKMRRTCLLILGCILSILLTQYGYSYILDNMDLLGNKSYYLISNIYGVTKISGIYFYTLMILYGLLAVLLNIIPAKKYQERFNSIIGILLAIAAIFQLAQVKIMYIFYRFVDTFSIYLCIGVPYFFLSFKESTYKQGMLLLFVIFAFCVMNYQLFTGVQEVYPYKIGI